MVCDRQRLSQLYLAIAACLTARSQYGSFQNCAVAEEKQGIQVPSLLWAHRRVLLEPRVWWLLIWAAAVWQKGAGLSALRFW